MSLTLHSQAASYWDTSVIVLPIYTVAYHRRLDFSFHKKLPLLQYVFLGGGVFALCLHTRHRISSDATLNLNYKTEYTRQETNSRWATKRISQLNFNLLWRYTSEKTEISTFAILTWTENLNSESSNLWIDHHNKLLQMYYFFRIWFIVDAETRQTHYCPFLHTKSLEDFAHQKTDWRTTVLQPLFCSCSWLKLWEFLKLSTKAVACDFPWNQECPSASQQIPWYSGNVPVEK
jgi:hypothetical protein